MWRTLLLALLACGCLCWLADGTPQQMMSAPNLLHVGTAENIFVECQDCTGADIPVTISVKSHPTKNMMLASTTVTLSSSNHFQAFGQVMVSPEHFSKDPGMKQYVYLQAQFPDRLLEQVVLVSFKSGYIFIQTDKTLYTPNSKVGIRLFVMSPVTEQVEPNGYSQDVVNTEIVFVSSQGLWRIVAKFSSFPQQSFSTEFEVKEYVLPSFEVKLTSVKPFFYVDGQDFTVNIRATYLFGEEVEGKAYVVFWVLVNNQMRSFPSSLQSVPIKNGAGEAILKREHITKHFPSIHSLIGGSLFVAVSVLTEGGAEMVEAELKNILIVESPYTISLKKTPGYYTPGMPLFVTVEVMNPDGTPVQGVPVVIDPGNVQGITLSNGRVRLPISTEGQTSSLLITARTNDLKITGERQASDTMQAHPHYSKSNSFIHLSVAYDELKVGDNLKTVLRTQDQAQRDITYLVLSRGQLVKFGRHHVRGHALTSLMIPITKEMLPSFRIIAYYHTNDNEVVSDSVWVDVKDSCMGKLQLELSGPAPSHEPRRALRLTVTGDPEATVGFFMVNKGVHVLNNNHLFTQKKVWDTLEMSDIGCTPGGGRDGMAVFYDAGLLFQSSAVGTPSRLEKKCSDPTRRKRAPSIMEATTSLSKNSKVQNHHINNYVMVYSRTIFPESWMWSELKLPACPRRNPDCDSTSHVKIVQIPDSTTTWQLTGVSLSRTHGICVSEPLEVKVRKDFFLDIKVPYSAVQGEQMEVKAILHNFTPGPIIVHVDLLEEQHVCSAASRHGRYRQEVKVGPQSQQSVPFIISPIKEGEYTIEVKAAVKDSSLTDGIRKSLHVVPQGVLTKTKMSVSLNPSKNGGRQQEILNSEIPKSNLVPNSPTSTLISVTGRLESRLTDTVISGNGMGTLIYQPSGNGEANMIHLTLPVIATMYLDKTNQWETVGFQKRNEAVQHIKHGYQQELKYRKGDGSFAVQSSQQSSSWLTAYVVKMFSMIHNFLPVQKVVICGAVKFLILNVQRPDGSFREHGGVIQTEMTGDVSGTDSDASMTAFCLIALQESRPLCAEYVTSLPTSIDKAVAYLENRLPSLTNAYAVAMASYALAIENKLNREILYRFASPDWSHWPVAKGQIYTVEATAYALLALVKTEAFEDARPVVTWLNQQQRVDSGYGSTQATLMVYQAVSEYWVREPEDDLVVTILLPGNSGSQKFRFTRENQHFTRTFQTTGINEEVGVTATGTGEATVTMSSLYYALPEHNSRDCQKFNMSVQLLPDKTDEMTHWLRIDVMYKNPFRSAIMSVLDIGLPTGFTVNTEDLNSLSQELPSTIARYEINSLSERGSLIIYLAKVSHTQPEVIRFRIHQKFKVGVLQPAAVSVYEYYDQTKCVKFYHPERDTGQALCVGDVCICDEGSCNKKKVGVSNEERIDKACDPTLASKAHFVYKVRLERLTEGSTVDNYVMKILQTIKEGSFVVTSPGALRTFLAYKHCRQSLDLRPGKTYLIMGRLRDSLRDAKNLQYHYVLSEGVWIEYWPTEEECKTEEYRPTCEGITELVDHLELFGCVI
ncbi:complement C3-like [Halichoeres trimaculatus]|uniref:complement C3-like n=1 Tax=Halichoeres trimaculatus TaxID=147232 RepID=UPI003D9E2749